MRRGDASNGVAGAVPKAHRGASWRWPVSRVLCRAEPGDGHPSVGISYPIPLATNPRAERATCCGDERRLAPSYLVLLRLELAAFHPCASAGIVTVALVLASRRTGVTREPALWSSDFPRDRSSRRPRPSGHLQDRHFTDLPMSPAAAVRSAAAPTGIGPCQLRPPAALRRSVRANSLPRAAGARVKNAVRSKPRPLRIDSRSGAVAARRVPAPSRA